MERFAVELGVEVVNVRKGDEPVLLEISEYFGLNSALPKLETH